MALLALLLSVSLGAAAPPAAIAGSSAPRAALSSSLPTSLQVATSPSDPNIPGKYFGARYYGSKIARFTTTDPFLDQRAALLDPQRWNRYSYGRNNPLRYVDPDGRDVGEAAAWVQNQVSFASSFYTQAAVSSGNPALAASTTFVASSLEIGINAVADAFRVGESTGAALGRGDSGLAFAAAVAEDAGRAGGLALLAAGGASSATSRTSLFRAVRPGELSDIEATGAFRNPPGSEVKYFSTTEGGARSYAGQAQAAFKDGPYSIVRTSIPKRAITPAMRATVDKGISTVVVPTEKLSQLGPPKVIP
jgi:RHS repeat-associated protein